MNCWFVLFLSSVSTVECVSWSCYSLPVHLLASDRTDVNDTSFFFSFFLGFVFSKTEICLFLPATVYFSPPFLTPPKSFSSLSGRIHFRVNRLDNLCELCVKGKFRKKKKKPARAAGVNSTASSQLFPWQTNTSFVLV